MGTTDSKTWVVEWSTGAPNAYWTPEYIDENDSKGILYLTEIDAIDYARKCQQNYGNLPHRIRNTAPSPVKGDMKAGLTNGKPQLSQFPLAAMVYATRAFEYGSSKYERGNYLRPTVDTLADFDRLLAYLDAGLRHLTKVTLEMNRTRGCTDQDESDLRAGANCVDPESGLHHLCGAITSIAMGIQQAVDAGLIPADPGRPWEKKD
jgi:hypothetical protein